MLDASTSGIIAAGLRMDVSAHNTANLNTDGARAQRVRQSELPDQGGTRAEVVQTDSPPELVEETVEQMTTAHYLKANAKALRTQDEMLGTMIDLIA
jgi:flagellar hook protein FlgE